MIISLLTCLSELGDFFDLLNILFCVRLQLQRSYVINHRFLVSFDLHQTTASVGETTSIRSINGNGFGVPVHGFFEVPSLFIKEPHVVIGVGFRRVQLECSSVALLCLVELLQVIEAEADLEMYQLVEVVDFPDLLEHTQGLFPLFVTDKGLSFRIKHFGFFHPLSVMHEGAFDFEVQSTLHLLLETLLELLDCSGNLFLVFKRRLACNERFDVFAADVLPIQIQLQLLHQLLALHTQLSTEVSFSQQVFLVMVVNQVQVADLLLKVIFGYFHLLLHLFQTLLVISVRVQLELDA